MKLLRLAATVVALMSGTTVYAQVDTDPNKEYAITPQAGAWVIKAAVFVGPESPQMAHELIIEIRRNYQLPAYVFNYGAEERRKRDEEMQRLHKQYDAKVPLRVTRIKDECAVLVGGYKDFESAHRALERIKTLPPPSNERLMPILTKEVPVPGAAEPKSELTIARANPFAMSFVTRNPTVPPDNKHEATKDPFLKRLNADEKYSLLKCKKPWTLLVATFRGMTSFHSEREEPTSVFDVWKLWSKNNGELLEASGQNAHNLAEAMRKLGFEAYVLHMRQGSVVTVGSFDSKEDPRIQQVQTALATNLKRGPNLQLLSQPIPMPVPRP